MSKLAYDFTDEELVKAFWTAVARAGVSNSGLVIDLMAGSDRMEAYYLHGVLLSRLEGKERPFTRDDRVRIVPSATYHCGSINSVGEHYSRGTALPDEVYEVDRTFYEKDRTWSLSFKGQEKYRYPAGRFEKASQPEHKLRPGEYDLAAAARDGIRMPGSSILEG